MFKKCIPSVRPVSYFYIGISYFRNLLRSENYLVQAEDILKLHSSSNIINYDIGGACNTNGRDEKCIQHSSRDI
jgi:hypothetical protein